MTGAAHALVITKPGYETVRFGPMTEQNANNWAVRLQRALAHCNSPKDTVFGPAAYDPGADHIAPSTVPGNVDDLMEPFRADQGYSDETFPCMYLRLIMRHGDTRASDLWGQACQRAAQDEAFDEAERDIAMAAADALAGISEAFPVVERAAASARRAVHLGDRWELGVPAEVAVYPADAAEHLAVALRALRAAGLCLNPAPKG